ncbi:MAG: LysR family transcriptional regulator [Pseudomonadota bacterium]
MDWRSVTFDWNRARAFLVTAEEGSLSAAARALGLAQPTLGRQVAALEEELGVLLFDRVGRSLKLTPNGLELIEHVRAMGDAAGRVSLSASGQSQTIEGTVRITSTEAASAYILPPILERLRRELPGVSVELVATNDVRDLSRREADIAIRSGRPSDPELIARKLKDQEAVLYAAHDYFERIGRPETSAALSNADFIGFDDDNTRFLEALNALGLSLTAKSFPILCTSHLVGWEPVKHGLGVGAMVVAIGDAEPKVQRAAPWLPHFPVEVWLVAHREVRTSRRVRLVFDLLADELDRL